VVEDDGELDAIAGEEAGARPAGKYLVTVGIQESDDVEAQRS